MLHPSDHLIVAVDYGLTRGGLQWSSFLHGPADCSLDTVEHASDISPVRSGLYAFTQLKPEVICAAPCDALSIAASSSESCVRLFTGSVFVCQICLSLSFDDRIHVSNESVEPVLAEPLFLAEGQHGCFVDGLSDEVPARSCILTLRVL